MSSPPRHLAADDNRLAFKTRFLRCGLPLAALRSRLTTKGIGAALLASQRTRTNSGHEAILRLHLGQLFRSKVQIATSKNRKF